VGSRARVLPPPPTVLPLPPAPAHVMARLTPAPSGPHDAAPEHVGLCNVLSTETKAAQPCSCLPGAVDTDDTSSGKPLQAAVTFLLQNSAIQKPGHRRLSLAFESRSTFVKT
jgi:hypothetical protein